MAVTQAPFDAEALPRFIRLERSRQGREPDGAGLTPEHLAVRGVPAARLTMTSVERETVGEFCAALDRELRGLALQVGEAAPFCVNPALQMSANDVDLPGVAPVKGLQTAWAALGAMLVREKEFEGRDI